ncbi:MAG: hypothetical protein JRK53_02330 [Deltaproteobacteria bacterium]|nr:hypothetical protein [Deltaproteobacteria bacterium]
MDEIEIHMSALSGKSTVHHLLNLLFLCGLCLPRRSFGEGWCLCERLILVAATLCRALRGKFAAHAIDERSFLLKTFFVLYSFEIPCSTFLRARLRKARIRYSIFSVNARLFKRY